MLSNPSVFVLSQAAFSGGLDSDSICIASQCLYSFIINHSSQRLCNSALPVAYYCIASQRLCDFDVNHCIPRFARVAFKPPLFSVATLCKPLMLGLHRPIKFDR